MTKKRKAKVIGVLTTAVNCGRYRRPDYWKYADKIEEIYKPKKRRKGND